MKVALRHRSVLIHPPQLHKIRGISLELYHHRETLALIGLTYSDLVEMKQMMCDGRLTARQLYEDALASYNLHVDKIDTPESAYQDNLYWAGPYRLTLRGLQLLEQERHPPLQPNETSCMNTQVEC